MINALTQREIRRRLVAAAAAEGRPAIEWGCSYVPETGVILPRADHVEQQDYDAAVAIVEATLAEGPRRYKTPHEFFASMMAYANYSPAIIPTLFEKALAIMLREWSMYEPEKFAEAFAQTAIALQTSAPGVHAQLEADGMLTFDATTTEPEPE